MKFICEKCKTKYSISDEKVKGKILKIRCKNCSNIIVVREPRKRRTTGVQRKKAESRENVLERAFDGAFKDPQGGASPVQLAPVLAPDLGPSSAADEFEPEATRLSEPPDFQDAAGEEEWYLAVDGSQFGPMGLAELCSRIKRGETGPEAYVWRDGYDDWVDIVDVPELEAYIPRHPPPPPSGKSGLIFVSDELGQATSTGTIAQPVEAPKPPLVDEPDAVQDLALAALQAQKKKEPKEAVKPAAEKPEAEKPAEPAPVDAEAEAKEAPPVAGAVAVEPEAPLAVPPRAERIESQAVPAVAAVPMPAHPGTPMIMKVTAAGGIIAALTGVVLVIYFLFIAPSPTGDMDHSPVTVAKTEQSTRLPTPPSRSSSVEIIMPDKNEIQFPAETINRSQKKERAVRPSEASAAAKKAAKRPTGPTLTAEQLRLKRLMGGTGNGHEVDPSLARAKRAKRGPSRRINASEITSMQKRYKKNLKACYERALKRDESLTELKAEITVNIGDSGIVRVVQVQAGESMELTSCLKRIIRRWVFPPVGAQTFGFPIIFRGS